MNQQISPKLVNAQFEVVAVVTAVVAVYQNLL
jgi:hypothetical protein